MSFFGEMDVWTNLFWILVFLAGVVIGIIWHYREKKKLKST